jgi:cation diffusion facilitator CzcD-associated flavoprotein CzcO
MLQRSPSYVLSLPAQDALASALRRRLSPKLAYQAVRAKNVTLMTLSYQLSRRFPEAAKRFIRKGVARQLPADFDIDTHFKPHYNPWDQRLCICPDGDLFTALSSNRASVITGQVESFTPTGLRLRDGQDLEADVIVTATGLNLLALGGIELSVDGQPVELPQRMAYKGLMLDGVPNAALAIGYTNASWTLKCDLTCEYVCRLLNHMAAHGYDHAVPVLDGSEVEPQPLIDLASGYVLRSLDKFPQQGSKPPWRLRQNYPLDIAALRLGKLEDGILRFSSGRAASEVDAEPASGAVAIPA